MTPYRSAFSSCLPSCCFFFSSRFQILDINVKATALLTKAVVPEMEKRGYRERGSLGEMGPCRLRAGVSSGKRVILFFFQRRISGDCGLHSSLHPISSKNPFLCSFHPFLHPAAFQTSSHSKKFVSPFGIPPSPFPQNRRLASMNHNLGKFSHKTVS